jgi:hypothetical protein
MKSLPRIRQEQGAALVVTLIVLVALATVVVAFMQNASMERSSSRSITNVYRAQLAAESGLADFLANLEDAVRSGSFVVVGNPDPAAGAAFTALGEQQDDGSLQMFPLASIEADERSVSVAKPFSQKALLEAHEAFVGGSTNAVDIAAAWESVGGLAFPAPLGAEPQASAGAVVLDDGGKVKTEFAYVATDESAKLNMALFGAKYVGGSRTNLADNAFGGEVAVSGVGEHSAPLAAEWHAMTPERKTRQLLPGIFATAEDRPDKERFYSFHRGVTFDRIPKGIWDTNGSTWLKFADGGKNKHNINEMATNNANRLVCVSNITTVIDDNLPNFYKRDPSFELDPDPPGDWQKIYPERIAAAIVDYIDEDDLVTSLASGEPAGKERTPYVVQLAERYEWKGIADKKLTIQYSLYGSAWNPYHSPDGATLKGDLGFDLETFREVSGTGIVQQPVFPDNIISAKIPVEIRPNEIKTYLIATTNIVLDIGEVAPKSITLQGTAIDNDALARNAAYKASWNSSIYDQSASYLTNLFHERHGGIFQPAPTVAATNTIANPQWSAYLPNINQGPDGLRYSADPRQNSITCYAWGNASYTRAELRWNGSSAYATNTLFRRDFERLWQSRDVMRGALHVGTPAKTANTLPTGATNSSYSVTAHGPGAPFYIRNKSMRSLAELGHIHDPVHVKEEGKHHLYDSPTDPEKHTHYSAGGSRTLRIGQQDFDYPTFKTVGQRSADLLNLFTTGYGWDKLGQRISGVNVNTASEEVLTSFFYNLSLVADTGLTPSPVLSLEGAQAVAKEVAAHRPYLAPSDLVRFVPALAKADNYSPKFSTNSVTGAPNILDRGREEIFERAYNFMDTSSGAFRFYGIGRLLDAQGRVVSQAKLEAQVELRAVEVKPGESVLRPVVTWKMFN